MSYFGQIHRVVVSIGFYKTHAWVDTFASPPFALRRREYNSPERRHERTNPQE
jgi:hypothetical protein